MTRFFVSLLFCLLAGNAFMTVNAEEEQPVNIDSVSFESAGTLNEEIISFEEAFEDDSNETVAEESQDELEATVEEPETEKEKDKSSEDDSKDLEEKKEDEKDDEETDIPDKTDDSDSMELPEENNVSSTETVEQNDKEISADSSEKVESSTAVRNYITYKMTRATQEQIDRYVKPDFSNLNAYGISNPYSSAWIGQCTWFTWGRFFEIYGYSPSFTGNGCDCVIQLVLAHPDKWEFATKPVVGSVFSADYAHNHVGLIVGIEKDEYGNDLYIVQEGNLNGRNDSWDEVETDCWTQTYTMDELKNIYGNVTFANPKAAPDSSKLRTDVEKKNSKKQVSLSVMPKNETKMAYSHKRYL